MLRMLHLGIGVGDQHTRLIGPVGAADSNACVMSTGSTGGRTGRSSIATRRSTSHSINS